jgi:SAM-dependent methyltransferase
MAQYDDVASRYARFIAPKYEPIAALVADVTRIAPGERVAELAVGTGALTRLLTPKQPAGGGYVAIDLSPAMLRIARETVDQSVVLLVGDVQRLPLRDGSFDHVVSSLGPVQETESAFAECLRVLRPGGRLAITLWGHDYLELSLLQAVRTRLEGGDFPTAPASAAEKRAESAGFTDVRTTHHQLPVTHDSVAAYVDYRAGFGHPPWLPADRQPEMLSEIEREAASYVDDQGRVQLDWQIAVLEATHPG